MNRELTAAIREARRRWGVWNSQVDMHFEGPQDALSILPRRGHRHVAMLERAMLHEDTWDVE